MDSDRPMTRLEAAAMLGVSDETVDRLIRRGELSAYRIGRRVLVKRESVSAYLARCQEAAGEEGGM